MIADKGQRPGRFIVLEGLDGAGTTTQTERLRSALSAAGTAVITSREPSDGPIGTLIRQALTGRLTLPGNHAPLAAETLALLFAADRTDHLAAKIDPALERGDVVLCDRYVLSSLAYQGTSLSMAWVAELNARARTPDLTLFLEVDVATALSRRQSRGAAEELFEARDNQEKIAVQYRHAIRLRAQVERIVRLDGTQPAEVVTAQALEHIHKLLG